MDQICLVVPILPGRTADAKDFMRELEAGRNADYQRSEQRTGIVKEAWHLAPDARGDLLASGAIRPCPAMGISRPGPRPCTPTT